MDHSDQAPKSRNDRIAGFAARLQQLRGERRLSQQQLAEKIHVAANTYASWEQDRSTPHVLQIIDLATFFGVSTDELLGQGSGAAPTLSERDVEWRMAWSRPTVDAATGAAIWAGLVKGKSAAEVASEHGKMESDLDPYLQDLILNEQVHVTRVPRDQALEKALKEAFREQDGDRLRDARVVKVSHIENKLLQQVLVGYAAKAYFLEVVRSGYSVGLCGGLTVARMVHAFRRDDKWPAISLHPVAVSPMLELPSISANNLVSALAHRFFGPVPVRAAQLPFYPDDRIHNPTRRVTSAVLDNAAAVDILFMGAGGPGQGALALDIDDYRHNYLWTAGIDRAQIADEERSIGNLMYYLLDEHGEQPGDFKKQNDMMVCSIELKGLRKLVSLGKRVVVMAQGVEKAQITQVAIRNRYANVLIVDDALARALIAGRKVAGGERGAVG